MKVILIDDEELALEVLSSMLSSYEDIEVVGKYTQPFLALEEINKTQAEVVFLDIEMGNINGVEISQLFFEKKIMEIVFITAYSKYAVDAFEINAIDYLLKPIQQKRLDKTIKRLENKMLKNREYVHIHNHLEIKVKVRTMGKFQLLDEEGQPVYWRTKKTKELFVYLWLHNGEYVNKYSILEEIFPYKDPQKASALMHTTVYQLRKSLKKLGFLNGISYFNEQYKLDILVYSDMEELHKLLNLEDHTEEHITAILQMYKRNFLEEEGYDWSIEIQQRIYYKVFNALKRFCNNEIYSGRLTKTVQESLERMYKMENCNEEVARLIILFLGKTGRPKEVESYYNQYKKDLWIEMRLKPKVDIVNLYSKYTIET